MANLAAHGVDRVMPDVGLRQWVVTVPWPRRWLIARRPDLARGVLAVAIRTLTRFRARRAAVPVHPGGRTGSVTVVQRFGSALSRNLRFHTLCLDGVHVRGADGLRFVRDPRGRERLCRYLARPALALTRMEEPPAGLIGVAFKRPWADGTAGVTLTPLELARRLAALVPPSRAHLVEAYGVLAGRSACRTVPATFCGVDATPACADPQPVDRCWCGCVRLRLGACSIRRITRRHRAVRAG